MTYLFPLINSDTEYIFKNYSHLKLEIQIRIVIIKLFQRDAVSPNSFEEAEVNSEARY